MNIDKSAELETQAGRNESLSTNCGWAVVAGLLIEVALAYESRHGQSLIETWAPVGADALVALGVFGEIHFAGKASKAQEELRRISNEEVAAANERAAHAGQLAAEANASAEQNRLERLKLEERFAPRTLTIDNAVRLANALREFAGVRADVVSYGHPFPEVGRVCNALANALHLAGWAVTSPPPPQSDWAIEGIFVAAEPDADERTKRAAFLLTECLKALGWAAKEWDAPLPAISYPGMIADVRFFAPLRIMVGFKPQNTPTV